MEKPKFDPTKTYTWKSGDSFTLTGAETIALLNTLRAVASSEIAHLFRVVDKSIPILDAILARHVESGIAQEAPKEEKSS